MHYQKRKSRAMKVISILIYSVLLKQIASENIKQALIFLRRLKLNFTKWRPKASPAHAATTKRLRIIETGYATKNVAAPKRVAENKKDNRRLSQSDPRQTSTYTESQRTYEIRGSHTDQTANDPARCYIDRGLPFRGSLKPKDHQQPKTGSVLLKALRSV